MAIYQKIYLVVHPMLSPKISLLGANIGVKCGYFSKIGPECVKIARHGPILGLYLKFLSLSAG